MRGKILVFGAATLLVCGGVLSYVFFARGFGNQDGSYASIYFFSAADGMLRPEVRAVEGMAGGLYEEALGQFFSGPVSRNLSSPWPGGRLSELLEGFHVDGGTLALTFGEGYLEMEALSEALFRAALTLTMTGLPGISGIEIRIMGPDGEELSLVSESAATIANLPRVAPSVQTTQTFTLYFVDEGGEELLPVSYVAQGVNMHFREQTMLEILIANQNWPGALPLIPPETRVLSVDQSIVGMAIYVNLSGEFSARFSGDEHAAQMMLASIANTLIANAAEIQARRVFFLIESERREEFHGIADFGLGFAYNEEIVAGFPGGPVPVPPDDEDLPRFDDDLD